LGSQKLLTQKSDELLARQSGLPQVMRHYVAPLLHPDSAARRYNAGAAKCLIALVPRGGIEPPTP
jgi:hypothetical protein